MDDCRTDAQRAPQRPARRLACRAAVGWAAGMLPAALGLVLPAPARAHGPLRISGTGSGVAGLSLVAAAFEASPQGHPVHVLPSYGSAGGIATLLARHLEMAVSNRPPSPQELARAAMRPPGAPAAAVGAGGALRFIEYARTPWVIAVHHRLGVTDLTSEQLANLYAPGSASYPNGHRARPVLRDPQDADSRLIGSLAPAARAAHEAAQARRGMLRAVTDTEAAELAEQVPGAFAGTTLAQILSERRPLMALKIDGREPSVDALAAGRYPFFKSLFVVVRADDHVDVGRFFDFLLSPPAQALLANHGHLPRSRFAT